MGKTVRGNTGLVEQPIQLEASHRNGGSTTRTFEYPNPNNDEAPAVVLNQYNALYFDGYDVKMTGGTKWTIVGTLSYDVQNNAGQSMPEPTWEIAGQPTETNLLEANINIVSGLSTRTKTLIEARLKNPTSTSPLTDPSEVSQLANATKVYNLMRAGADSKRIFVPTVKRTISVSRTFSNLSWTLGNVGNVVSRTVLINDFSVPSYIQPLLDTSTTTTGTDGIAKFSGYLVFYPTVSDIGSNRVQISQEFVYGLWSSDIYTVVS